VKKLYRNKEWLYNEHWVKGKSVRQIAKEQKVGPATIRYHLIKNDVPIQKADKWCKQYPNLETSSELAYILGVLDGDGSVRGYNRIILGTKDFEFAKEFEKALLAIGLRANVIKIDQWIKNLKRQYHGWQCYAYSVVFVNWYNSLTQERKEGIAKQYPKEYLRGFFESEGSYVIGPNGDVRVHFSNTNRELLMTVQRLLALLGYESKLYEFKHKSQFIGQEVTAYRLNLLGSSEKKHGFVRELKPVIKNQPYDYSDPNGLRVHKQDTLLQC